jgi:flagellar biosynthetic protein FliR
MGAWTNFLSAMVLTLVRVSGIVVFAPFFSSSALPARTKAVFVAAIAFLLAPLVSTLPHAHAEITLTALLGEVAVGLVYGIVLSLLNEMLLFAGQIAGVQFSFSMVNLLDPTSTIQTPLMGDLFQLLGTLVLIAAGLDRIVLASLVRSFRAVPLGAYTLAPLTAPATMLVEIAVALLSKLSPQLPVMSLTVPLKTLVGFAVLTGFLALWPRFIEARFSGLLDLAERMLQIPSSASGGGLSRMLGVGLGG